LLVGFRKLPFTCSYPLFQHSAVVVAIAYVLAYFVFTAVTSELESQAFSGPFMGVVVFVISLGVWYIVHRVRSSFAELAGPVIFEDTPAAAFELLHLSEGDS